MQNKLQKGFTLLELSITTVLMTFGIVAMIQMQAYQAQLEVARSIAQIYQRLNNAAGSYLVNYYDILKGLPDECSNTGLGGATMGNRPAGPPITGCATSLGTVKVVNVVNGLQPTLSELRQLGLLNGADGVEFNNTLPMPTFAGSNGNPFQILNAQGNVAAAAFGVLIQKITVDGANDLRSLVYNRQPYNIEGNSRAGGILLDQILLAAGADAYLSDNQPGSAGQLRAQAGAAESAMPNPLKVAGPNGEMGAPYVFAMRNGYGSAGYDRYVRRDGSTPLTKNWDVGGKDISGVGTLGVNTVNGTTINGTTINGTDGNFKGNVKVDGTLTGSTIKGTSINGTDITGTNITGTNITGTNITGTNITGTTVNGTDGNFTGNFITNTFQAVTAYIKGALTVVGDTLFKGSLTAEGSSLFKGLLTTEGRAELKGITNAYSLRLQSEANLGDRCDPDLETLRKALSPQADAAVKLLVCDPQTRTWVRAQADYAGDISAIYNRLGLAEGGIYNINTSLVGINSTIDANNTKLDSRVSAIEKLDLGSRVSKLESGLINLQNLQSSTTDTLSTLGTTVSTMSNDVTTLKKNEMRWDILNVTWAAAKTAINPNTGKFGWGASDRVWKKTPWKCVNFNGTTNSSQSNQLPFFGSQTDGVRWLQNASDYISKTSDFSSTPPMLIGLDSQPNDFIVYDVNCGTSDDTKDYSGNYWYIGMSAANQNVNNGNACRQGLGSTLDASNATMYTYNIPETATAKCKNFNVFAPSFNQWQMSARFIAFTRAP